MNDGMLQELLDRIAITSWQRWMLLSLAIVSALGASTISAVVEGQQTIGMLVLVIAVAFATVLRPDSHFGLATEVLILWQWLISADDVTTPWSIGIAWCLFTFHCCVAMMAVTPITAVVARPILAVWARRGVVVAVVTIAMWLLVSALDQRDAVGRGVLTAAALLALAALTFVASRRSIVSITPTGQVPRHDET